MKYRSLVGVAGKMVLTMLVMLFTAVLFHACDPENNNLGVDIFPSEDTIMVYSDTITDLETRLVRSRPRITSVLDNASTTRTYFLGSMVDSIRGHTRAEIVTELGLSRVGEFGEEPYIDSLRLSLFVNEVLGDTAAGMRIRVYEFTDSLDMGTSYYSDYDVTGKYDPEPLVDEVIVPEPGTLYDFDINDPELLDRIIAAANPDDSTFFYPSRTQRLFRGLYITMEPVDEGGALAKLQLTNSLAGLKFKYFHDTIVEIAADTIPLSTYTLGFNDDHAQKVNIFQHDFTGTTIATCLDDPGAVPGIAYAQGMAGVNVKVTIPDITDYVGEGIIAINAARLVFYVVPDSIMGIPEEDYPQQLMMETRLDDGTYIPMYDRVIATDRVFFGMLTQSNENSAFLDPLYFYTFNIARHLQSVVSGEIGNGELYIYVDDPATSNKIIKFWSNHSGHEGGLKLELIYTKF
ncbi:MAG: DUF4270 family protein [Bacteroidales bacterium]|nr:DUF4270 family protein [Bacteroidales bacterium]MDT8430662.1 DUF4270 family protein [Bacteroidales bacterium]